MPKHLFFFGDIPEKNLYTIYEVCGNGINKTFFSLCFILFPQIANNQNLHHHVPQYIYKCYFSSSQKLFISTDFFRLFLIFSQYAFKEDIKDVLIQKIKMSVKFFLYSEKYLERFFVILKILGTRRLQMQFKVITPVSSLQYCFFFFL